VIARTPSDVHPFVSFSTASGSRAPCTVIFARARQVTALLFLDAGRALRWGLLTGGAMTLAATPALANSQHERDDITGVLRRLPAPDWRPPAHSLLAQMAPFLVVRTAGDPGLLVPTLRAATSQGARLCAMSCSARRSQGVICNTAFI
jgi:hypothetical protein